MELDCDWLILRVFASADGCSLDGVKDDSLHIAQPIELVAVSGPRSIECNSKSSADAIEAGRST
jgi:hypothetical protein